MKNGSAGCFIVLNSSTNMNRPKIFIIHGRVDRDAIQYAVQCDGMIICWRLGISIFPFFSTPQSKIVESANEHADWLKLNDQIIVLNDTVAFRSTQLSNQNIVYLRGTTSIDFWFANIRKIVDTSRTGYQYFSIRWGVSKLKISEKLWPLHDDKKIEFSNVSIVRNSSNSFIGSVVQLRFITMHLTFQTSCELLTWKTSSGHSEKIWDGHDDGIVSRVTDSRPKMRTHRSS